MTIGKQLELIVGTLDLIGRLVGDQLRLKMLDVIYWVGNAPLQRFIHILK